MNRRKLQRRTTLAVMIRHRWFIRREFMRACADIYREPRKWSFLGEDGLMPTDYDPPISVYSVVES